MIENNGVVTTTRNGTLYLTYQTVNLNGTTSPVSFLGHARDVNMCSGSIQTGEKLFLRDSPEV
jgi:hypothetical protein